MSDYRTAESPGPAESKLGTGEKLGLIGLFRQLPGQISRLIRDELRSAQVELLNKLRAAGVGAGLLVGAAILALYGLGVLIAAAILGLATVLEPWFSALIVGLVLLVIAVVLALLGRARVKNAVPPLPTESIDSVKEDIRAVRGDHR